ncbi:hypothetical protein BS78_01G431900 [Paspalum vaginatum]|nr:hypothetical protein BS78_01G431900 [Paspalum vaginatum]
MATRCPGVRVVGRFISNGFTVTQSSRAGSSRPWRTHSSPWRSTAARPHVQAGRDGAASGCFDGQASELAGLHRDDFLASRFKHLARRALVWTEATFSCSQDFCCASVSPACSNGECVVTQWIIHPCWTLPPV